MFPILDTNLCLEHACKRAKLMAFICETIELTLLKLPITDNIKGKKYKVFKFLLNFNTCFCKISSLLRVVNFSAKLTFKQGTATSCDYYFYRENTDA